MDFSTIKTALDANILTITINRPEKLNALNKIVLDELEQVIQTVYDEKEIRAAIITGEGSKAFVAGADISEFTEVGDEQGAGLAKRGQQIFFKIENCPKPVVAAVNGFALGCRRSSRCGWPCPSSG